MPQPGNEHVVRALEEILTEARKGKVGHLCASWGTYPYRGDEPTVFNRWYGGDTRLDENALTALRAMHGELSAQVENYRLPEGKDYRADFAVFNGAVGPLSYDFANWLIEREMERIAANAPAPLKVAFFFGKDGKFGLHEGNRRQMFECVVRPMLGMVGAVENANVEGNSVDFYCARGICEKARAGHAVPKLRVAKEKRIEVWKWLGARRSPMVITLREASYWPQRNSNIEAWVKFAGLLKERGHDVIFVRDTAKAYAPCPPDFSDCPQASMDLAFRMALYQSAACCFFTSNGPHMLTVYSDCPYLVFIPLNEDGHEYEANTPRFWREKMGVEPPGQFPWAKDDQRIIWSDDSYDNIVMAWDGLNLRKAA